MGESVTIGVDNEISITVLEVHGKSVRLGFVAPDRAPVYRSELRARKLGPITGERTAWVYEGGWLSMKDNATWIEWNCDAYREQGRPFQFREIARYDDYVELHDESRRIFLRLDDEQMKCRLEGQDTWNVRYQGHWKR
jgi:hypothetical protein